MAPSDVEKPDQETEDRNISNPFDPTNLRLSQNFTEAGAVKKRITVVQVRKPGKQEFVRIHPDPEYRLETALLILKEEGEVYLVDPALWDDLAGELIPTVLFLTINRQGIIRLWPVRLPDESGNLDSWNHSALQAAEIAQHSWVRVSSNRAAGMYETFESTADLDDPEWPDLSFKQILEIAFRGRYIDDWNHPALRRLRGEQ
jgi:hypothetical protein